MSPGAKAIDSLLEALRDPAAEWVLGYQGLDEYRGLSARARMDHAVRVVRLYTDQLGWCDACDAYVKRGDPCPNYR